MGVKLKPEFHQWATTQFDRGWNAGLDAAYKYHMTYLAAELEKVGFIEAAEYLRGRSEQLQQG
jgi:hypothetical protein